MCSGAMLWVNEAVGEGIQTQKNTGTVLPTARVARGKQELLPTWRDCTSDPRQGQPWSHVLRAMPGGSVSWHLGSSS